MSQEKFLVIGACGQVGSELCEQLRSQYSDDQVIAADIKTPSEELKAAGPFEELDVLAPQRVLEVVKKHQITQIFQLAAMLSATAEQQPMFGWKLNMEGLLNVLNIAKDNGVKRIFWPSSIAVFGPGTPKEHTPQDTVMDPNTVYGISKLAGERWCEYYYDKYDLDVRSIRYPGLISYKTMPGGGTTDYAIDIFVKALQDGHYDCFLGKGTSLPMLFMPDAVKATIDIMHASAADVKVRSSYNLTGFSFTPEELAEKIKQHLPNFTIAYEPDFRQQIADSWPSSIDDSQATQDWGWKPAFSLDDMVKEMLDQFKQKLKV